MTAPAVTAAHRYAAAVLRVIDGDTLLADVDLGAFGVWARGVRLRLRRVDCPELPTPAGQAARDFVCGLIPAGSAVYVEGIRADNYGGRWDAFVTLPDGRLLNDLLVEAGHGRRVKSEEELCDT